jgi:hypothetical protein
MKYPFIHLLIALLEVMLVGFSIQRWRRSASVAMAVLSLVLASMAYDNTILAIGNLLGAGELLKALSLPRFLLHYILVPLFIVVGVELAYRAGAKWANTAARSVAWVVALVLAGIEITTRFANLTLEPVTVFGVLRYSSLKSTGAPVVTIGVMIFMILIGIGLWLRLQWPWLFFGGLVALVGNAIPVSLVGTILGSLSELIIGISLLLAEQRVMYQRKNLL